LPAGGGVCRPRPGARDSAGLLADPAGLVDQATEQAVVLVVPR
jgi:hypothetical protein